MNILNVLRVNVKFPLTRFQSEVENQVKGGLI